MTESDRKTPRVSRNEELVLRLLAGRGELYGLQVVKASNGAISRGAVYTLLNRGVDKGLIEDREEEHPLSHSGMVRRVYKISGVGERALSALDDRAKSATRETMRIWLLCLLLLVVFAALAAIAHVFAALAAIAHAFGAAWAIWSFATLMWLYSYWRGESK